MLYVAYSLNFLNFISFYKNVLYDLLQSLAIGILVCALNLVCVDSFCLNNFLLLLCRKMLNI